MDNLFNAVIEKFEIVTRKRSVATITGTEEIGSLEIYTCKWTGITEKSSTAVVYPVLPGKYFPRILRINLIFQLQLQLIQLHSGCVCWTEDVSGGGQSC